MNETTNYFEVLNRINVNDHIEKKGRFSYLSWPFAYAELFKRHPQAQIVVREWDGFPAVKGPKGWMVCVTVKVPLCNEKELIYGFIDRTQWHPILDNNNRTIAEPDVFQINTSIQRAAVKAIALHGLGLYIYAGEDLPDAPTDKTQEILDAGVHPNHIPDLTPEEKDRAQKIATTTLEYHEAGDNEGAYDYLQRAFEADDGVEIKTAVKNMLPADLLKIFKKINQEMKA